MPSIQLKTAALAPIPSVRHRIARRENPGLRRSIRRPYPTSWITPIPAQTNRRRFGWKTLPERTVDAAQNEDRRRPDGHQHRAGDHRARRTEPDADEAMADVQRRREGNKTQEQSRTRALDGRAYVAESHNCGRRDEGTHTRREHEPDDEAQDQVCADRGRSESTERRTASFPCGDEPEHHGDRAVRRRARSRAQAKDLRLPLNAKIDQRLNDQRGGD